MTEIDAAHTIQKLVLEVHRRNGGRLDRLDFDLRLLDRALVLDSLDLAEIMVGIERQFGLSPFEAPQPPKTWKDLLDQVQNLTRPE